MFKLSYRNTVGLLATILALAVVAGFLAYPKAFNKMSSLLKDYAQVDIGRLEGDYRLGLDLQGGTHLIYEADVSKVQGSSPQEAMDSVRDVIERRVNIYGVAEPLVQVARSGDSWRLIVELAGITDVNEAIKLIGETPFLEFREEVPQDQGGDVAGFGPTTLNGSHLVRAQLDFEPTTREPIVSLQFNSEGARLFEELTRKNLGKRIAIYLDGAPISDPRVETVISGGQAIIRGGNGGFPLEEAKLLAGRMNAGALPIPITLISEETIGASLGQESLAKALNAALWSLILLTVFMVGYYRFPGLVGILTLCIYVVFMLALFMIIPVTLTLAGIAALILSLGMALDASILIFERMKEEIARGRSIPGAVEEGFARAWTSVRDGNLTTIITAFILYWIGSSFVQGFALTLIIGIALSMFTAIFVSRLFLEVLAGTRLGKILPLWKSGLN